MSYPFMLPELVTIDPVTGRVHTRFTRRLFPPRNIINTVPREILAEIFLGLLEDDDVDLHHSIRPLVSRACHSDPLILGRVCSYWRNVALDTPQLWSRICILKPQRSQVRLTHLWLERAHVCPLDISIWESDEEECDRSALQDIMTLFFARREYWRKFSFTLQVQALKLLAPIMQYSPSINLLQSATLRVFGEKDANESESDNILDNIWKAIHSCKSLRFVDWRSAYNAKYPEHCPWNKLTGLTLSSTLSFDRILDVLSLSPQLKFLRARSLTSRFSEHCNTPSNLPPITHTCLETLYITSAQETGPLFRRISLPALRVLKICHKFYDDVKRNMINFHEFFLRSNSFHEFFLRSDPRELTTFELDDLSLNEVDLCKYLKCPGLQNLLHFTVHCNNITDRVIQQLAKIGKDGSRQSLPSLRVLQIGCDSLQTTDGVLSHMVASRISPINKAERLKKVNLWTMNIGPIDKLAFSDMFSYRRGLEGSITADVYG
ncbi:hypothetical protein CPB84DRAFT_1850265 [Gymnopilus junonius]|uniref:F-box domain-containing protein n=1 Tax=Gymnopilus junonius TaxID=109634 RepID=A0A9P5NEN1_GYMJU|nr:hypothetical protein CPB84DRAFT_1850265 [Gymnopilus junonius]